MIDESANSPRDHISVGRGISLPASYWDAISDDAKARRIVSTSTYIRRVLEGEVPPPDALRTGRR